MTPIFNTSCDSPQKHIYCKSNLAILAQIHTNHHANNPNFWLKVAKMTFSVQWMHSWCKFGDPSPNLWRFLHQQPKFPIVLIQTGQMTSKFTVSASFSIPGKNIPRCMFGAKFGDSSSHLWSVNLRKLMVRQIDGPTQTTMITLWPERPRMKKLIPKCHQKMTG